MEYIFKKVIVKLITAKSSAPISSDRFKIEIECLRLFRRVRRGSR